VDVQVRGLLTSALVGGEWSVSPPVALSQRKELPVTIGWEDGLATETVWMIRRNEIETRYFSRFESVLTMVTVQLTAFLVSTIRTMGKV
jgi:hypothetical protein